MNMNIDLAELLCLSFTSGTADRQFIILVRNQTAQFRIEQ